MPVHVAGEEIHDLHIGQIPVCLAGTAEGIVTDVGEERLAFFAQQIQTVGIFHKGALHHAAVLVQILHVGGAGAELRQAKQTCHGAHGAVAVIHPVAVPQAQIPGVYGVGQMLLDALLHAVGELLSRVHGDRIQVYACFFQGNRSVFVGHEFVEQ